MQDTTETLASIELGKLRIDCYSRGMVASPILAGHSAWGYRLVASVGEDRYECEGHGSVMASTRKGAEEMCWNLADDLLSAANDPEDFWSLAIGMERPAREKVQNLDECIAFAERHKALLWDHSRTIDSHR